MAFCKFCGKEIPEGGACDCAESVKDAAASAVKDLKDKAEATVEAAKDKVEDAAEAVKDKAEAVKDKAEDAVEAAADKVEEIKDKAEDAVEEITKSDKKAKKEKKKKDKKDASSDGKKTNKLGVKIVVVLILIALIAIALFVLNCVNSAARKKPVKQYVKGLNKCNVELILDSMYPEEYIALLKKRTGYDISDSEKSLKSNLDSMGFKKAKVKFIEAEKLKDDDFDRIAESYNISSDGYAVEKAYKLRVEVTLKTKKGKQPPRTGYMTVVKLDEGGWKYYPYSDSSGLSSYFSLY